MHGKQYRYVYRDLEVRSISSIDVLLSPLQKCFLPVRNLLTEDGEIVCLIKPQFEAGREKSEKKALSVIRRSMKKSLRKSEIMP